MENYFKSQYVEPDKDLELHELEGNPIIKESKLETEHVIHLKPTNTGMVSRDTMYFKAVWDTANSSLIVVILSFSMKYMSYLGLTRGTSTLDKIFSNWFNFMYGGMSIASMIGFIMYQHDLYTSQTGKKNLIYYIFLTLISVNYILELSVFYWSVNWAYVFSYLNLYTFYIFNIVILYRAYKMMPSNIKIHAQNSSKYILSYYILDFIFINVKIFVFTFDENENLQLMNICYFIMDIIFTVYQLFSINTNLFKVEWSWDISFNLASIIRTVFSIFTVIFEFTIIFIFSPYTIHIFITMISFVKTVINIQIIGLNYTIYF